MPAPQNPTKAFEKYRKLQFKLRVLKNQKPEENQAEVEQIETEMDKEWQKMLEEERLWINRNVKLPKSPQFCKHETCGG